jgi:hypothetical protein
MSEYTGKKQKIARRLEQKKQKKANNRLNIRLIA